MTKRVLLGNTGAGYDLLVSKPGVDVTTANAGDLLIGKATGVQQLLASGLNQLSGFGASMGGTYTVSLSAFPYLSGLSNLLVWGRLYIQQSGGSPNFFYQYTPSTPGDGNFKITSGNLIVVCNSTLGGGNGYALFAQWAIFRFRYT